MLAETRAELDDFHQASKELEAELESELQRTEKAQQDLQAKAIRSENERDDWKVRLCDLFACLGLRASPHMLDQVHVSPNDAQYDNHVPPARARSTSSGTSAN